MRKSKTSTSVASSAVLGVDAQCFHCCVGWRKCTHHWACVVLILLLDWHMWRYGCRWGIHHQLSLQFGHVFCSPLCCSIQHGQETNPQSCLSPGICFGCASLLVHWLKAEWLLQAGCNTDLTCAWQTVYLRVPHISA